MTDDNQYKYVPHLPVDIYEQENRNWYEFKEILWIIFCSAMFIGFSLGCASMLQSCMDAVTAIGGNNCCCECNNSSLGE